MKEVGKCPKPACMAGMGQARGTTSQHIPLLVTVASTGIPHLDVLAPTQSVCMLLCSRNKPVQRVYQLLRYSLVQARGRHQLDSPVQASLSLRQQQQRRA